MTVIPVAVAVTIPWVFEALYSVYPAMCPILRDQDTVENRARGGVPIVMERFVAVDHCCHRITARREREQRSVNRMSGTFRSRLKQKTYQKSSSVLPKNREEIRILCQYLRIIQADITGPTLLISNSPCSVKDEEPHASSETLGQESVSERRGVRVETCKWQDSTGRSNV